MISPLVAVLSDAHHASNLDKSMLACVNIESHTLGFVSNEDADSDKNFEQRDSEAGTFIDLGNKEFMQSGIDYPNTAYDAFQKTILLKIASGLVISYNNLANDLTSVNFSSIRQDALVERAVRNAE